MAVLLTLSVRVNVATATPLGKVIAAAPPIVLLIAVGGLLREQRGTAAERTHITAQAAATPTNHPIAGEPQAQPPTVPARALLPAVEPRPSPAGPGRRGADGR